MNYSDNKQLYLKVKSKKIPINCVCEVGVYLPETSNIIDFIEEGTESILVEPDPDALEKIKTYFSGYKNIKLYPVAVFDHNGRLTLSKAKASTFVSSLPKSPALVNDNYKKDESEMFEVDCVVFDEIDNSSIDLLSIDTEGAEWYVIKNLKSRPKVISIETHGKFYTNPYIDDISKWITDNNYKVWYKTKSDTVYYLKDQIHVDFLEKSKVLADNYIADLILHKLEKEKTSKLTGHIIYEEFYPRKSKSIIDEMDKVMSEHYGFTQEELDFIINYDIKYRMGKELENGE